MNNVNRKRQHSVWQCGPAEILEATETLPNTGEDNQYHQKLVWRDDLHGGPWKAPHWCLCGKNWSEARMPSVPSYVSSDDGLGTEDIYSPRAKWYPMDTVEAVGWPALLQTLQHVWALKVLKANAVTDTPIMLEGEALDEVESFTYQGNIVANTGGTEAEAFQHLKNVWWSSPLGTSTTIRIFNTIVKPVLLYRAKTWKTTIATTKRIQTFINTCLK